MEVYKLLLVVWFASFFAQLLVSGTPYTGEELKNVTSTSTNPLGLSSTMKMIFDGLVGKTWLGLTNEEPPICYVGYIMFALQNISIAYLSFRIALGLVSRVIG